MYFGLLVFSAHVCKPVKKYSNVNIIFFVGGGADNTYEFDKTL